MSSEPEQLGWLVKRLQHRHHRVLDENLTPLGVSLVQWNALREIDRNPGAPQRRLAQCTFNSDQAFGTLVARLLQRRLVERRAGVGRAIVHRLTPRGRALLRRGQKVMSQVTRASFAPLTGSERDQLERLLTKVLDDPGS